MNPAQIEVLAPNFKRRHSGVTSTIIQLVPVQAKTTGIATVGPGLPASLPSIRWWQIPQLFRRPTGRSFRVWHARRNVEMLAGVVMRDVLRMPLRLVFTSASQRHHRQWTKWLVRRMDAVVATSAKTAAYLDVPNTVVMHGVDTERFAPAPDRQAAAREVGLDPSLHYVGCFGRVRRQKGTDLFVDAMLSLLPDRPGWGAVIAGRATGEHARFQEDLMRRVEVAGLSDRIRFVGEHRDIERWYRVMSLFVAPQRWEGFGLTPLEAMSSGVPVVAADVGAFSELIEPGVTGVIIPPDDLPAMTEAVARYLDDASLVALHGQNGRARVLERFQLAGEAGRLADVYERLV